MTDRNVQWEGFYNARDLGGLPTRDGKITTAGAFARSADVRFVTAAGWRAAHGAGFTTVVDLREPDEVFGSGQGSPSLPDGMQWRHVPLDDTADRAFWAPFMSDGRWGTPLYYAAFLRAKADRVAAVFTAMAQAEGGVVFHCAAGRDRTGLVTALLLSLAEVQPDAIADDFALTTEAARPLFARVGLPDQGPAVEAALAAFGTTGRDAVLLALHDVDVRAYLLSAGVTTADVDRVARRLRPIPQP